MYKILNNVLFKQYVTEIVSMEHTLAIKQLKLGTYLRFKVVAVGSTLYVSTYFTFKKHCEIL